MHQSLLNCFKPLRRGAGVGHNRTGSLKKAQQHPHFPFQSLDIILELVLWRNAAMQYATNRMKCRSFSNQQ